MRHTLIDSSTAAHPTGPTTGGQLFRVPSGPFAGRVFAVFAPTPSVIAWTWAAPPHNNWQDVVDVITDAADEPFAAIMDREGNVYLVYTQSATGSLTFQKFVFASGTWAAQSPSTVYDSVTSVNRQPSILKDSYDRVWVAWASDDSGVVTWRVKRSIDDGQTFGGGAADPGTDLSGNLAGANGILVQRGSTIHSLHIADAATLWNRQIGLDDLTWSSADSLYTGAALSDSFHAALAPDGMLGVVFAADSALWFREYDGVAWRPVVQAANQAAESPSVEYIGTTPHILFLVAAGIGQQELRTCHGEGGGFTDPIPALTQLTTFASVVLYDADAPVPYADGTNAASDSVVADVFHPTSGALLKDPDDAVYLGGDDRFSFLSVILDTAGTNGTVAWSYWDGATWQEFTPDSGSFHFDSAVGTVRLFADGDSTPAAWQKSTVDGRSRYWIRVVVQSAFTTAPIASQLTAIPNLQTILPLRG